MPVTPVPGASSPRRAADAEIRLGIYRVLGGDILPGRGRIEFAVPETGAVGAGDRDVLLPHQALHVTGAPGAGILAGNRPGRRLDRHARFAGSPDSLAHRRGDALDCRIRHHLRLPGLRLRRAVGTVQHPPAVRHRPARCGSPAFSIWGCWLPGRAGAVLRAGSCSRRWNRRRRRALALGTPAGPGRRPVPDRRGLLHHERLRQRDILCILGHGYLS